MELTRRELLGMGAMGAAYAYFFGPDVLFADGGPPGPALANDRILVVLQLSGGNDGLSTVVPFGDDAYGRARQATRIAAGDVLKIDDYLGLHPNLKGLRKLLEDGKLAIVQGVGYPNPTRSHFQAMDVWHAADRNGRKARHGWLGRLADTAFRGSEDPNLVIHIGNRIPFSLEAAEKRPIAFTAPQAYRWVGAPNEEAVLEKAAPLCEDCEMHAKGEAHAPAHDPSDPKHKGRDAALERMRKVLHEAQESSEDVRTAARTYEPKVAYPASPLSGSLATVAALITGGLKTRIYSVETGGFDTHTGQRPRHDRLMNDVDSALTAFVRDLEARKLSDRVTVLAFSEFGRRVQENGSQGTDHGVAGPMFLAGAGVKGGLHGKHPSLVDLDAGDLKHTTDFRSVYASVVGDWFGADPKEVLGGDYKKLELLRRPG